MSITVREKIVLKKIWYALGACNNDTVVIKEENGASVYYWSNNGGKDFYLQNEAIGEDRILLRTKQPAGGICSPNRNIASVSFLGQSLAQRNCVELKRLIHQLRLTDV